MHAAQPNELNDKAGEADDGAEECLDLDRNLFRSLVSS
jgi:hypothetical protein